MSKTIKGAVYDKFSSVRAFARALGWDRTKTNDIVTKKREPRVSDVQAMAQALELSVEETARFFLQ